MLKVSLIPNGEERFKKNELKPWKVKGWVLPPQKSGEFVACMEKVLHVHKRPYQVDYPVICMDESPKQLIEMQRESIAMKPGRESRGDYEYIRNGVVNIFMANKPLRGKRLVEVTESKIYENHLFPNHRLTFPRKCLRLMFSLFSKNSFMIIRFIW